MAKAGGKTKGEKSARKSWVQKRDIRKEPEVKILDKDFAGIKAGEKMLIPTPAIVDEYIRQIPRGTKVEPQTLRNDLAMEFHAHKTCPVTTGIFLRIVSEAAYEEFQEGKPISKITPFWRVVDPSSATAKKLTFGTDLLKEQLRKEGIS